jgi:hypothetical protein
MMETYVAPIELKTAENVLKRWELHDCEKCYEFHIFITYSYPNSESIKKGEKGNVFADNKLACKVAED